MIRAVMNAILAIAFMNARILASLDILSAVRFISYIISFLNKTIIPVALVGYEVIIANLALRASLATYYLITNAC